MSTESDIELRRQCLRNCTLKISEVIIKIMNFKPMRPLMMRA